MSLKVFSVELRLMILWNSIVKISINVSCSFLNVVVCGADILKI